MSDQIYQIIVVGVADARFSKMRNAVLARAAELGVNSSSMTFIDGNVTYTYSKTKPVIAIYFGHKSKPDSPIIESLLSDSAVIVPVVTSKLLVNTEIPDSLSHINALQVTISDVGVSRLASLILENFRLLRKDRGVFISYRRKGSQPLANKLYDALDKRGFDVFIDVRSVPPAVDFQAELWHRMSDTDVIVLIDTPGFREGRWTKAELAQANLLGIQTLHLLWPGQKEDRQYAFSRFMPLTISDFKRGLLGRGGNINPEAIERICNRAEELRAEAIALRHTHLVDNFCEAARDVGMTPTVQPQRWVSVTRGGETIAVVPAVGRPTSDRINLIFDAIRMEADAVDAIWVIYDARGLHDSWVRHLKWLDSHLPIRTVGIGEVPMILNGGV